MRRSGHKQAAAMDEEDKSIGEKVKDAVIPRGPKAIAEPDKELRFTRAAQAPLFFAFAVIALILLPVICLVTAFILGILGWAHVTGKIATIVSGCIGLLSIPAAVLFFLWPSGKIVEYPTPAPSMIEPTEVRNPGVSEIDEPVTDPR